MDENPIASDIKQFILADIDSVAELEALLLLRADPAKKWDVASIARRLYISEQETSSLLASLCDLGLIVVYGDDPPQYLYKQASDDLSRMADRLADVYAKHLVRGANLIHSKQEAK